MGICLLIVNDDFRCRDIASQVLRHCNYEELHTGRLMDALNAISEKRDTLNPVLITNVHRLGEKGSQILNQIRQLNFEIIYMTPDDKMVEWKRGEEISTSAYVVNVLSIKDINYLWESALAKEKVDNQEVTSAQMAIEVNGHVTEASRENPPSAGDGSRTHQKRKRKEPKELSEQSQGSGDDHPVEKKPRVVWTKEMHRKFLEAIETLGPDKAFPKKIVELMNEPGLTRENVASHLQKYRLCLKKNQEEAANSSNGMNPCFSSFQPFGSPFQQGSCGIISMPSLGLSRPFTGLGPSSFPCNDSRDFMHMQSKHFTRYPASTSFRIYDDKTKNILLSTEDGCSSSNSSMPSNSENVKSFIGLRFTTDGKSLEFGQTSVSGNNEIQKEMFSSVETSGTEKPDHSNPLTSASYSPEPPNTLSQNGSHQNEVSDYSASIFGDCSFEQEPFLALLDRTFQQNHDDPLPHPCNSENPAEFLSPSTPGSHMSQQQSSPSFLEVPTSWNSSPTLYTPGNVSSLQYPTTVLSFGVPEQEISFPLLGTSGNVPSIQESSTTTPYQISMQESSMPLIQSTQEFDNFQPVDDINSFLNETAECSNPKLFWEWVYDYAHHNHVN